jgi:ATP-dependent exoDNAse (exonuclease V) alpha subunit
MEFTFKSGYKLYLPFALNNEQRKALLKLEEFMNSGNKEITLSGYAGTGKTTLISLFDKYLSSQHRFPYYTAPTHRANAVTKLNNPNARVLTLHKLFGLSPDIRLDELGNYDIRDLEFAQKNKVKIQRGDLLIIDESSMVSDSLYDFIQKKIQELNIKVIYVGDKGQIKPVGQKNISKVFSANQNPQIQLTKVERTGDNAILEESTNLRNGRDFTYVSNINDKGIGVQYMDSTKEANDIISAAFTSENFKKNKLFFRILSGTNQVVKEYNALVRRILFNTNEQLVEVIF